MVKQKIIDIKCKNGHLLFHKYRNLRPGNLMRCYINQIGYDLIGVDDLINGTDVYCPTCQKNNVDLRIGRIGMVHGRPAVIVNHDGIKSIRTN